MRVKIVKIILVVLLLIVLAVGFLAHLQLSKAFIINKESYFSDFYVKGDKAYIECEMSIKSPRDCSIQIQGTFMRDEGKLLKNATIFAYDIESGSNIFNMVRGTNRFRVVFIGDYGGIPQKFDKLLPEIELIALDQKPGSPCFTLHRER